MLIEDPPKASLGSRMSLAIIIEPGQANAFGTLHGGVMLKLADECGAIAALGTPARDRSRPPRSTR